MFLKKQVILNLCFLLLPIWTFSQTTEYCKIGLFGEYSYYSDMAIEHILDTTYSINNDYQGNPQQLKLDLHYPNLMIDPLAKRPLVILVHGGGYVSGNKSDLDYYAMKLAKAGYVVANIDYRQGWEQGQGLCNGDTLQLKNAMYRGIQDLNAAFFFLSAKSNELRIDTNQVFLAGQSEGAMIAMHTAFLNQTSADSFFTNAFANLGSIYNMANPKDNFLHIKGIFNWCGAIIDTNMIQGDKNIPILSIHGLLDSVIFINNRNYQNCILPNHSYPMLHGPKLIYERLKNLGICSQANYDINGEHCFYPSLEEQNYIPSKSICFFKNILCGNCITEQKDGYNFQSCMEEAPLQIESIGELNKIEIYPNPCNENLYINIQFENKKYREIKISMIDINGLEVWHQSEKDFSDNFYMQRIAIDNKFPKGIYILKIQIESKIYYKKISIL